MSEAEVIAGVTWRVNGCHSCDPIAIPQQNIGRAGISTIAVRSRTNPPDDGNAT
jgi:hypothetical protein